MENKASITREELITLAMKKENFIVVDVRSKEEFAIAHIPFAINITLAEIERGSFKPEVDAIIVTVCGKGGGRSEKAAEYLRANFPNQVFSLEGGTLGWFEKKEN